MKPEMKSEMKRYLWIWIALMLLLALTARSAFLPMGIWNSIANIGISIIKTGLVVLFFMHLRSSGALIRIVACAALFTLSLLFIVSAADYITRGVHDAEWEIPKINPPPGSDR